MGLRLDVLLLEPSSRNNKTKLESYDPIMANTETGRVRECIMSVTNTMYCKHRAWLEGSNGVSGGSIRSKCRTPMIEIIRFT